MKTILVLAPHPDFAEAIRTALSADSYRIVHRTDTEEAEPLLTPAFLDACIIDVDQIHVQGIWMIEKVRRRLPSCPLLVYTEAKGWEWEEEAYVQGVRHVLTKPVKSRILTSLLDRLWTTSGAPSTTAPLAAAAPALIPLSEPAAAEPPHGIPASLQTLRDLSAILSHSLCADALLKQFLLHLREIIGVNRSALFLRESAPTFGGQRSSDGPQLLRSSCAIGLPQGLLDHFKLTFETGIGAHLFRHGRILRRDSREAQADPAIQKEFELLGVQVAVPLPDRETLVGVALFDGRVTGEPLSNAELELVFHLLEALGLAIRNIWLHDQLAANSEMMTDVLRQLSSGCVVVGRDLSILHANKAARHYFARGGRRSGDFDFSDLPQVLGSKVYQVLKTGTAIAPFNYRPPDSAGVVYQVSIVPVQSQQAGLPGSALLIVEDHTQTEQLHRLELETTNLRLVKQMADRLAHEVGNAMVPLSTHQQLFAKKYNDPEFRASLDTALSEGVRRVTRLVNQMRFLARDNLAHRERIALGPLLEEAYQEAQKYHPLKSAQLKCNLGPGATLQGDRASLKHAFAEILLNALQANPNSPKIGVSLQSETDRNGTEWMHLDFRDNGSGFTAEAARRVPEPFFTTRNVGLGLGLVVTRKVAETHQGRLEILRPKDEGAGIVRLSLPISTTEENSQ